MDLHVLPTDCAAEGEHHGLTWCYLAPLHEGPHHGLCRVCRGDVVWSSLTKS